jgi:glycosyltransferase involved in cell wall biosynthesis
LINELVLDEKRGNKVIEYVPHGLNHEVYYPIEKEDELKELEQVKSTMFGGKEKDFVVFFNSRNIRRKQIPDTMLAFKIFLDTLPKEKAEKCAMVMHTEIVSDHGTDLDAVRKILFNDYPEAIYFSQNKLDNKQLNQLYNIADAQILLTSNEGWGLSLTEAILAGTVIIANVTGGMQDQMGFEDEFGNWYTPSPEIPSNHTGRYKNHGVWAFPVFPTNRSIQGSPKTPYIWDDRCNAEDAAVQIAKVYDLDRETRKELGKTGRHWAINDVGFTGEDMGAKAIMAIDQLFNTWTPREKHELINVNDVKEPTINHKFVY